uniref:protein mono-ADP-ribosyltransferase PARP14-like n=1 Tax=Styela clava TaxID=7725 RepID=UPI00193A6D6F|nr:protein mono-ADP-ribosyltransferase PARP14-like [Styela clava]
MKIQNWMLVTFEQEDIDTVDMKFEDLEKEIKKIEKQFTGYSLYDYLSGEGKFIKKATEHETKCSIFLDLVERKSSKSLITVKFGDILQEKCDAIVNSTGKSLDFSGQVSMALKKRFGADVLGGLLKNSTWVIGNQLCLCDTSGRLPWKYIFNIAIPTSKSEFTRAILCLLTEAERLGIQSLALPTIGAGNMGLDPTVVASYMKDAFARFDAQKKLLHDIRVVVYQSSQLSVFQDIIPKQDINKSIGMNVKIYGSSVASLDEAMKKFQESCDKIIKSFVIKTTRPDFYGFEKSEIEKFCRVNDVLLEWKWTKNVEECHIQGLSDNVKKVKDMIDKLLEGDYPANWSSMPDGQNVKRVELSEISHEYLDVKRKFEESQPSYSKLIKIERVQNKLLYSQFKDRRNAKKAEFAGQNKVITRQLFHGTSFDIVDNICDRGFDRNFSGKNGTAYGSGVYFAVKSQYSVGYCRGPTKYMFFSEVITGDYIYGNSSYKAPPEKSQSTRYDSCVDNQSSPNIFVVFSDSSVYPSYIITFQ